MNSPKNMQSAWKKGWLNLTLSPYRFVVGARSAALVEMVLIEPVISMPSASKMWNVLKPSFFILARPGGGAGPARRAEEAGPNLCIPKRGEASSKHQELR